MKRLICALLIGALALCTPALAAAKLSTAWMVYEDYSGNRAEQNVEDADLLKELEAILRRAFKNPTTMEENTVNCTLFCMTVDGDIYDFACATDGSPYIQNRTNNDTYTLGEDYDRFWEIFTIVREAMGVDASEVWDW